MVDTVDTTKLRSAAILQDYFVDKLTGEPLAGGTIWLYKDNDQITFKNWFYQTGSYPNYTFTALSNPLTLSSVGTIVDVNGNNVIPFYYPWDESDSNVFEAYYIKVFNSDKQLQFVVKNFPLTDGTGGAEAGSLLRNYIINNRFWRNVGSQTLTNNLQAIVAPSQHDGFGYPDIQFLKDQTGAVDLLTFNQFQGGDLVLQHDIQGEYYLNHQCTSTGISENFKLYQFPISFHLETLQEQPAVATIQARSTSGGSNQQIILKIFQCTGSNASGPSGTSPVAMTLKTIPLTSSWTKTTVQFTFPSSAAVTLSAAGDDAFYLQVCLPTGQPFNIDFALPSIYLGTDVSENDFETYDQIDSVINSPRTGFEQYTWNNYVPLGWIPGNDGSIGITGSAATTRANIDTWPLYNILWNNINFTGKGTNAYTDFAMNNLPLPLPPSLGRVAAAAQAILPMLPGTSFTSAANIITLTTPLAKIPIGGEPIAFTTTGTLPAPLTANTVYYITNSGQTASSFSVSSTLDLAKAGTPITLTAVGTGNVINASGLVAGESTHTMTMAELAAHTHTFSSNQSFIQDTPGDLYTPGEGGGTLSPASGTTGSTGNGTPFNLLQPTTFKNLILKL